MHLIVWVVALAAAARLASGGAVTPAAAVALGLLFLGTKSAVAWLLGSFHELWGHTSLEDLVALVESALLSAVLLAGVLALVPWLQAPPTLALVDAGIAVVLLGGFRLVPRIARELVRPALMSRTRPVVLAGRAELLDLELRRMHRRPAPLDRVVGLVVDGSMLEDALIRRVRVLGWERLGTMCRRRQVAEVIVVPPATASFIAALERLCARAGVACRSAASLLSLLELSHDPEPLLGRAPIRFDDGAATFALAGRRILVTGAGGSIGSEMARQLCEARPAALLLVDRSECALFHIERQLAGRAPCPVEARILDVRDARAVQHQFSAFRPQVIFHAAAHKHVPLMESHPAEAVLNNVVGTRVLADAAEGFAVESFVFISTDKAVQPRSVMGATKRIGELYIRALAGRSSTRFSAVRFGNVLGSNGSVLPLFIEQIQRGGPVTVTHPDMERYFMSIPEACRLVLEAAALGTGGEVFVLDMGRPMKIVELARRLIERAGLRPGDDVPIVFAAPRPGEKLTERLTAASETVRATSHPAIRMVEFDPVPHGQLRGALDVLEQVARAGDGCAVIELLGELVPEYRPALEPAAAVELAAGQ